MGIEMMTTMIRTFRELRKIKTFEERFHYLKLKGIVGQSTFGYDRYLNQILYTSGYWRKTRNDIIVRDNGCDLSFKTYEINDRIIIHHMNPITIKDIELDRDILYDPEGLICTSDLTHKAIHYGDENLLPKKIIERRRNDMCPWRD